MTEIIKGIRLNAEFKLKLWLSNKSYHAMQVSRFPFSGEMQIKCYLPQENIYPPNKQIFTVPKNYSGRQFT